MTDYARRVRESVAKHGFHVTCVSSKGSPGFCYSTGIDKTFGLPEVFVSSLPPRLSHELVSQYVERFANGKPPINQRVRSIHERFDYFLIPVSLDRLKEYVLASWKFYGDQPFEYVQLIFPDVENRFPHERGYDYDQEILGEFPPLGV